jgi:hypothetical protein
MDFKEYLLTQTDFSLKALAFRMWPDNKTADHYLSVKLHNLNNRSFTEKDEKLARKALAELGIHLTKVAKQKP